MKKLLTALLLLAGLFATAQVHKVDAVIYGPVTTAELGTLPARFNVPGSVMYNSTTKTLWLYYDGTWNNTGVAASGDGLGIDADRGAFTVFGGNATLNQNIINSGHLEDLPGYANGVLGWDGAGNGVRLTSLGVVNLIDLALGSTDWQSGGSSYLLRDGTSAMLGNLNMGGFSIYGVGGLAMTGGITSSTAGDIGTNINPFGNIYGGTFVSKDGAFTFQGPFGSRQLTTDASGNLLFNSLPIGADGTGTDDQIAAEVPFTPTGNTAATDVQAALVELQTDIDNFSSQHLPLAGGTMSGNINMGGGEITSLGVSRYVPTDTPPSLLDGTVYSSLSNETLMYREAAEWWRFARLGNGINRGDVILPESETVNGGTVALGDYLGSRDDPDFQAHPVGASVWVGTFAGLRGGYPAPGQVAVGFNAGSGSGADWGTSVGYRAAESKDDAGYYVAVGAHANQNNNSSGVHLGYKAGQSQWKMDVAIGTEAGMYSQSPTQSSIAIGYGAMKYNSLGDNVVIGNRSYETFVPDTPNAITFTDADISWDGQNTIINIPNHGFTSGYNQVVARYTSTGTGPSQVYGTNIRDNDIILVRSYDVNNLVIRNEDRGSAGLSIVSRTTHTLTPMLSRTGVTVLGNNIQPDRDNTTYFSGGAAKMPNATVADIDAVGNKALPTVEWINAQGFGAAGATNWSDPVNASIVPDTDQAYNLGAPSTGQWLGVYAASFYGSIQGGSSIMNTYSVGDYANFTQRTTDLDPTGFSANGNLFYYNSTLERFRFGQGGTANLESFAYLSDLDASNISFTPYSTIAATTVQGAIQELLDEAGGGGDGLGPDGDKGQITVGGGGTTLTIDPGVVTGAMIANGTITGGDVAANTIDGSNIALGGVLNSNIADNAVTSTKIQDGSIQSIDIGVGAIENGNILDGTISTADIADLQVTGAKIAASAVSGSKIAANAITSDKIAVNGVATDDLTDNAVTLSKMDKASAITGKNGHALVVDEANDQVDFVNLALLGEPTATVSRDAALSDINGMVNVTSATDVTITIPANATTAFDVGTILSYRQKGAGDITINYAGGVTGTVIKSFGAGHKLVIWQTATDVWEVMSVPPVANVTNAEYTGLATSIQTQGTAFFVTN